jgi:hypothetical protein
VLQVAIGPVNDVRLSLAALRLELDQDRDPA